MYKKTTIWFTLGYAIAIILLGYIGYRQSASIPSFLAGLILGGVLLLSGVAMLAGKKAGGYTALAATLILTGVFAYRYAITGKGTTAGLTVISAGMLLYLLVRFKEWKLR